MEIKWLGAAGFEVKTGDQSFLVDPYLPGKQGAVPKQERMLPDAKNVSRIFVSHGHFDHIRDIPGLALQTHAKIYCSAAAAKILRNHQVDARQIEPVLADKKTFNFQNYTAQAMFSRHIRFDLKLVISTLLKTNFALLKYLPLFLRFRCGQVLSWRFIIENKTIQFFGSAGSSLSELKKMGETPVDILLLPLQGHSDICRKGLNYVRYLKPKMVIPHHHDDFSPPISTAIDIRPFVDNIKKEYKATRVIVLKMNEVLSF